LFSTYTITFGHIKIYTTDKSGLSTLKVVNHLARRFRINDKRINFAGMKDKYAVTSQYLSILGKGLKEIKEKNFRLIPLGRSVRHIGPDLLKGNSFIITLRSLEKESVPGLLNSLHEVSKYGFPNYFGEQRFGSIRNEGGFLAKRLIVDDYEGALRMYLSGGSSKDRQRVKEFKKHVSKNWGNWEEFSKLAPSPDERRILTYLMDYPKDFVGAVNLINPRLLSLFIAAYQSYLWNEMARDFMKFYFSQDELITFRYIAGEMVFYKTLSKNMLEELSGIEIPLLDRRVKFQNGKIEEIAERVIKQEGVEIENFRLNKIKKAFFKSVLRRLIVIPEGLEISKPAPDEINAGRFKLTVSFILPSGSYATVLLRRLGLREEKG
jgi:tRNA pseudouridine13 synthase